MEKIIVYSVWCDQTDLSGIQVDNLETVKDIIEGDMENTPDEELPELEYRIKIEFMTVEEFNNLPEYEG